MNAGKQPMEDVIVVVPGITGSMLTKDGKSIWDLNLGTIVKSIASLGARVSELTLSPDLGEDPPNDGVEATGLMPSLHVIPGLWSPVTGYDGLMSWLNESFEVVEVDPRDQSGVGNLLPFAYDWRLSNRFNAGRLKKVAESVLHRWQKEDHPDAKLIFVCHSMGGLIARYYLEVRGGAEYTRSLITLGTPYRGALRALDALANGVPVHLGPLHLDFTEMARSFPSAYQLLPEYACVKSGDDLISVVEARPFPESYMLKMAEDAAKFHAEIGQAVDARGSSAPYATHPIVGIKQRTMITAELQKDGILPIWSYRDTDWEERGDGTVPRLAARPKEFGGDQPGITYPVEQHGSLTTNRAMRDHIWGILTANPKTYKTADDVADLSLFVPEIHPFGTPLPVVVESPGKARLELEVTVVDEGGTDVKLAPAPYQGAGKYSAEVSDLQPGAYHIRVGQAPHLRSEVARPVTTQILVWDENAGAANGA